MIKIHEVKIHPLSKKNSKKKVTKISCGKCLSLIKSLKIKCVFKVIDLKVF